MGRDADIVVVGAGITGVATARALAQAGRGVIVVEQFGLGHDRGSSHGATRIFRLSYSDPHYVRLAQGALQSWRELEAECGEQLIVPTGGLDFGPVALENARALAACGVRHELPHGRGGDRALAHRRRCGRAGAVPAGRRDHAGRPGLPGAARRRRGCRRRRPRSSARHGDRARPGIRHGPHRRGRSHGASLRRRGGRVGPRPARRVSRSSSLSFPRERRSPTSGFPTRSLSHRSSTMPCRTPRSTACCDPA